MMQVKDGKVKRTVLPKVGHLLDGRSVSGYDKLPTDILKAEGWLPSEEVRPLYDAEKERLVFDRYEILKTKVNIHYKVEVIPEPVPSETEVLRVEFDALKSELEEKEIIAVIEEAVK